MLRARWLGVIAALVSGPAGASVVSAAEGGFEIVHVVTVRAPPATVWSTLVAPGRWWNPAHTWSGDAVNLSLDLRPGGCFCERWPEGGVEHMRVVHVAPARLLRLAGSLGPLQQEALSGTLTVELAAGTGDATVLTLRYVVGGFRPAGLRAIAAPVDTMLGEQVERLTSTAERATR